MVLFRPSLSHLSVTQLRVTTTPSRRGEITLDCHYAELDFSALSHSLLSPLRVCRLIHHCLSHLHSHAEGVILSALSPDVRPRLPQHGTLATLLPCPAEAPFSLPLPCPTEAPLSLPLPPPLPMSTLLSFSILPLPLSLPSFSIMSAAPVARTAPSSPSSASTVSEEPTGLIALDNTPADNGVSSADGSNVSSDATYGVGNAVSSADSSADEPQSKKAKTQEDLHRQRAPRGQAKRPSAPAKSWPCPHPGCDKVLLGPNSHNVNKHVLKMHPDSPIILRCSMCSDFRTMKRDELENHTRGCLGRSVPSSLPLPMGAPIITLPTPAVTAEASPEPLHQEPAPMMEDLFSTSSASSEDTSTDSNASRSFTPGEIETAVEPYIAWRGQVGSTEHERVVKKAIIDTPLKQAKLRTLLRRYFSTAARLVPHLFAGELDIRLLVDLEVVQALFQHQETHRLRGARLSDEDSVSVVGQGLSSGVGCAAKYELRNELRKVIVFVISRQSRLAGRLLFPEQHPSYHLVTASARYVGQRRKREQRDRMRFGLSDDERIMTGEEQAQVLAECRAQLDRLMELRRRLTFAEEQAFTDVLVVALLLLLLGPRQEVLSHTTTMNLKAPRTLGNPRDTYYLQVSGHLLKDGPFSGAIPGALTAAVTYYLQRVRPLTVEGPMFVGTNGLARVDFSTSTRRVTMAVLGRPITAHRFRHSQVTDELQRAEVTAEVRRDMATHRGHSVQVQEQHYNMQRLERTQMMMQGELLRRAEMLQASQRAVTSLM